jgi:hypothetical protein
MERWETGRGESGRGVAGAEEAVGESDDVVDGQSREGVPLFLRDLRGGIVPKLLRIFATVWHRKFSLDFVMVLVTGVYSLAMMELLCHVVFAL